MNRRKYSLPPSLNFSISDLSSGLIIGIVQVFLAISFAALIFSGDLSAFTSQGISMALLGMAITSLVIAGFTSLPGTIGGSQDIPVAIITVMAAAIVADIQGGGSSPESFMTVVAAIVIVTMVTGLFFWGMGRFQLGDLVRFLPYPVAGGFLAATGWLLLTGAIDMMAGLPLTFGNLTSLVQPELLVHWLPGLILALLMFIATRKSDHYIILPAFLVGGVLLFFTVTWIMGFTLADLGGSGWLLSYSPTGETAALPPLSLSLFGQINWSIIAEQGANMLAIMAVSAIGLLLNVQGLELVTDHDLDVNHELQAAGTANILAGLAGGLVGYQQLSVSMLNFKISSKSRLSGLIAAAMCLLAFFGGVMLLSFFPKIIMGSLLVYLGLNFLYEWVIEGFLKLPRIDYAIVIVILIVTMSAGFLEGVVLGLLLATILFVVSYSQIDIVHHEMDGAAYRSRVTRTRLEEKILIDQGRRIYILQLQGFVFFGTANNLLNNMRKRLLDPEQEKPDFIILDFKRVTGLDSTGLLSFKRMKQLMEKERVVLLFTEPNGRVLDQLTKHGLNDDGRLLRIFPRLDLGMERCEEHILASAGADTKNPPSLEQQLQGTLFTADDPAQKVMKIKSLLKHFERLDIPAGQILIKNGDAPDNLYFIESGQLTAQLQLPGHVPIRLETSGSGNVFGEIGFYLGTERTADVIADMPCVVYRISMDELQKLERTHPEAASTLHQINAYLLAERMVNKTISIKSLES